MASAIQPLEGRRLLASSPVDPASAIPFQHIVIDSNPGRVPVEKVLADVNGDGKLDAVIGHENNFGGGRIDWYAFPASGNPNDAWSKYTIATGVDAYEAMLPFDINSDGAVDIVTSLRNELDWYENPRGQGKNPATTAWTKHLIGSGGAHEYVFSSDLDGDGKLDLATNAAIFFQNTPTSWTKVADPVYSRTQKGLTLFDSGSGLGRIDLVGTGESPYSLTWYENPRDHGGNARTDPWIAHVFAPGYDTQNNGVGIAYESIDVNGDGRADILSAEGEAPDGTPRPPGGMIWWEAPFDRINGTWIKHTIDATLQDIHNIRLGDMNNDGITDIIFAEQDQSDQKRVGILFNVGGTGQNWQMQVLGTYGGHNQWVADDDGDGDLDILSSPHGYYSGFNPIDLFQNGRAQSGVMLPVITSDPSSQTIPLGEGVDFSVSASANAAAAYQWLRDGVVIPGATSSLYHLAKVIPSDEGAVFECVVSDSAGFVKSDPATLHVDGPVEPVAWATSPNLTLGGGATYQFSISYADNVDILAATLGNGDVRVTGPSGYSQPATLLTTGLGDGPMLTALYSIPAPSGAWKNGDNGTYTISLQGGQVIDELNRYFPSQTLGTFAVAIAPMVTPALGGSQAAAASGYNLTSLGTSDWAHWGRGGVYGNFDHLFASTSLISNITIVGAGASTGGSTLNARSVSWNNGAPAGTVTNDHGYIWNNGALGSGFSFTVPADTTTRTLYVYAGGTGAGTTLTAHLSDGSMPDFVAVASGSGAFSNLYTITYRAPSAGRTLTVTYLKTQNITGTTGTADLIAAALINAPQPPLSITGASFFYDSLPQTVGFTFDGTQPITAPASGVLSLINLTTNDSINYAVPGVVGFDGATRRLTWAFSSALPDGNYRATFAAGALTDMTGNPLASAYSFDFGVHAGDANGDRAVDLYDLIIVANNWQATGKTFSQGDFNYDGSVNSADLGILASKWQQKLNAPPPPSAIAIPTAARRSPTRTPTRVTELVI